MPSRFHVAWPLLIHIIKKKSNTTNIMATENFMGNSKSAQHTRFVEYETVYFLKAVKYDESQQKRIRGLPKTQLS
jgi:hypothetical protein